MARPDDIIAEWREAVDWGRNHRHRAYSITVTEMDAVLIYIAELEDLLREAHGYLPACTGIEEDIAALNLEQPATPASERR